MLDIIYFDNIESTNTYALSNIDSLLDRQVIVSWQQTNGRGRLGRTWVSDNPNNIYMTIVLKPENMLKQDSPLQNITQYMSVIVAEVVDVYLEDVEKTSQIKWPNDILVDGKKVSGILAESVVQGSCLKGYVLGVGINLNMELSEVKEIDKPADSLSLILNKKIERNLFLEKLLEKFFENYDSFLEEGFLKIRKSYRIRAFCMGKRIKINTVNDEFEALVTEILDDGQLQVRLDSGEIKNINIGEIIC
jgi:BirA family transcriptional regulator, biotin operon repressor / biotin---[acetyl-CoA-carboxylase] ligase